MRKRKAYRSWNRFDWDRRGVGIVDGGCWMSDVGGRMSDVGGRMLDVSTSTVSASLNNHRSVPGNQESGTRSQKPKLFPKNFLD